MWREHTPYVSDEIEEAKDTGAETVSIASGDMENSRSVIHIVYLNLCLQCNEETGACHEIRRVHNGNIGPYVPQDFEVPLEIVDPKSIGITSACFCLQPFVADTDEEAIKLPHCQDHYFHRERIHIWLKHSPKCPYCKTAYGVIEGDCPAGSMFIDYVACKLPGQRKGAGRG